VGNLIPPAQRRRIIPFPVPDSNSVPTLFRLARLSVFDIGTSNRHKFIFDFIGEVALKSSEARFWLRQVESVSDCKAYPHPPCHQQFDCHLTVSTFLTQRRLSLGRNPFISSTRAITCANFSRLRTSQFGICVALPLRRGEAWIETLVSRSRYRTRCGVGPFLSGVGPDQSSGTSDSNRHGHRHRCQRRCDPERDGPP